MTPKGVVTHGLRTTILILAFSPHHFLLSQTKLPLVPALLENSLCLCRLPGKHMNLPLAHLPSGLFLP